MKLTPRFTPKATSAGFINGALIIGIALIGVVVAAISMASSSSTVDLSPQKAKARAASIVEGIRAAGQDAKIQQIDDAFTPGAMGLTFPAAWTHNNKAVTFNSSLDSTSVAGRTAIVINQMSLTGRFAPEICVEINKLLQVPDYTLLNSSTVGPGKSTPFAAYGLGLNPGCLVRASF